MKPLAGVAFANCLVFAASPATGDPAVAPQASPLFKALDNIEAQTDYRFTQFRRWVQASDVDPDWLNHTGGHTLLVPEDNAFAEFSFDEMKLFYDDSLLGVRTRLLAYHVLDTRRRYSQFGMSPSGKGRVFDVLPDGSAYLYRGYRMHLRMAGASASSSISAGNTRQYLNQWLRDTPVTFSADRPYNGMFQGVGCLDRARAITVMIRDDLKQTVATAKSDESPRDLQSPRVIKASR